MTNTTIGIFDRSTGVKENNIQDIPPSTLLAPNKKSRIGIFPRKIGIFTLKRRRPRLASNDKQTATNKLAIEAGGTSRKKRKLKTDGTTETSNDQSKKQRKSPGVHETCNCGKHHDYPCFLQGIQSEPMVQDQSSREMSFHKGDFNGFFPRPVFGVNQCSLCLKHGHYFETCPKKDTMCFNCEQYGHFANRCPIRRLNPSELGFWLFMRQVEDDTLSRAMSYLSLQDHHPNSGHDIDSPQIREMPKESFKAQDIPKRVICYRCKEEGHYAYRCPKKNKLEHQDKQLHDNIKSHGKSMHVQPQTRQEFSSRKM